ncbi:MAG: 8-amino-7-oxononanoate synthase [Gammaproteobacteria bacterium]|nr:MAG: 8-amino-7-oxononanoate synthase [Gammaproteobacteria bacterium]
MTLHFEPLLRQRKALALYRRRRVRETFPAPEVTVDGRRLLAFCSNDYLGLAAHPALGRALARGAEEGVGSSASQLILGYSRAHRDLEEALAEFTGYPRTLLFSSGYLANLGVMGALVGKGDTVLADRRIHASLIDGIRLSGARLKRHLHRREGAGEAALIVTEGVFSMDGDISPLPAIASLAEDRGIPLVVDDAHGFGILGDSGKGSLEHWQLGREQVAVLVGTLGKALGTFGAFVAGSGDFIEFLLQEARTCIYTTAPPPPLARATLASLRILQEEPWRREVLMARVRRFREGARELGLPLSPSRTPIQPVILGSPERALEVSGALLEHGILVPAIRPPTVPRGTARLRITFSCLHREEHVDRLLEVLGAVL